MIEKNSPNSLCNLCSKYIFCILITTLFTFNIFAQTEVVNYFEDFNTAGYPNNIPADSYWMYYNEIDPSQDDWNKFIPGDGNAYVTVDTDISNDLDWINPFQSLIFGGVGENHRLEVRMKGAVVDGGLVSFLFTYEQEGSEFNEVDLELVADDSATPSHPTLPENGGWTDARFNTWRNANENTNRPFTGTKKAVINDQNEKISLIDDEFHIYTIDWRSDRIDFFIDGVLQETLTTNIATGKAEVIFGFRDLNWAGDFNWSGKHTMVIDYFKVEPLDQFLLAVDDNYTMIENEVLELKPLTKGVNDRDPNNLDISVFSIASEEIDYTNLPQTIIVEEAGVVVGNIVVSEEITFTPVTGKTGTVTFPYVIKNTNDEESTANQIIEIYELSSVIPLATDDFYDMDQGETLKIRPLTKGDNDSDPNNLDLTVFSIAGQEIEYNALPQTIVIEESGIEVGTVLVTSSRFEFTPAVDKTGTISFPYVIKNEVAQSATANQVIEVNGVASAGGPTATDDFYTIDQGETLLIRPLTKGANDSDPSDLDLTIFSIAGEEVAYNNLPQTIQVEQAGNVLGTVLVEDDKITFTPSVTTTGNVIFPYVIQNTIGESATANQVIEVIPVNSDSNSDSDEESNENSGSVSGNPIAVDDMYSLKQGTSRVIKPLTRHYDDYNPNGLALIITFIGGEEVTGGIQEIDITNATISINEDDEITFIPNPNYSGTITFPYVIQNTNNETATGLVHMIVDAVSTSAQAPRAVDDTYTIAKNTKKRIAPLTTGVRDKDLNGEILSLTYINGEEVSEENRTIEVPNGILQINSINDITFIPHKDYLGVAMFSYEITNSMGISDTGLQTIHIIDSKALHTDDFVFSEKDFSVYPNPSNGNIFVNLTSNVATNARVILSDVTGKTVYSSKTKLTEGLNTLNFNFNVSPGVLFLKITSNNQSIVKRLIIK